MTQVVQLVAPLDHKGVKYSSSYSSPDSVAEMPNISESAKNPPEHLLPDAESFPFFTLKLEDSTITSPTTVSGLGFQRPYTL